MSWGVFEIRDEYELLVEIHVAPVVELMRGVTVMSAAHRTTPDCECNPRKETMRSAKDIPRYIHNDPDHPGSLQLEAEKQ